LIVPLKTPRQRIGAPARFYPRTEVLKATILSEIRRTGGMPKDVQHVARRLSTPARIVEAARSYLLTDGESVYFARSSDEVITMHKQAGCKLWLIDVRDRADALSITAQAITDSRESVLGSPHGSR